VGVIPPGLAQKNSYNSLPSADDGAELAALARLAGSGDPIATRRFLDWIWPTLARVVNGVLGARHADVDDVMQQSLLAVLQALSAFRGECHPAGYASRIALHVALRARRNAGIRLARSRSLAQLSAAEPEAICFESEVPGERRKHALRVSGTLKVRLLPWPVQAKSSAALALTDAFDAKHSAAKPVAARVAAVEESALQVAVETPAARPAAPALAPSKIETASPRRTSVVASAWSAVVAVPAAATGPAKPPFDAPAAVHPAPDASAEVDAPPRTDAAALFAEANRARRDGNGERAEQLYRALQASYPSSAESQLSRAVLAQMLLESGNPEGGSIAIWRRILRL
jgi:DNA-directed RNA polymerase specialized sigma24 family protein